MPTGEHHENSAPPSCHPTTAYAAEIGAFATTVARGTFLLRWAPTTHYSYGARDGSLVRRLSDVERTAWSVASRAKLASRRTKGHDIRTSSVRLHEQRRGRSRVARPRPNPKLSYAAQLRHSLRKDDETQNHVDSNGLPRPARPPSTLHLDSASHRGLPKNASPTGLLPLSSPGVVLVEDLQNVGVEVWLLTAVWFV